MITSFYPSGDKYITSDAVFGVKKSLVVVRIVSSSCPHPLNETLTQDLKTIKSGEEARAKGFPPSLGDEFALLERNIVLASHEEGNAARAALSQSEAAQKAKQVSNV